MSDPPDHPSRMSHSDDALLSGLSRLRISQTPARSSQPPQESSPPSSPPQRPRSRPLQPARVRSAPSLNVAYAYFPRTITPRHADRFNYVPRADWIEVIEYATGLGRSSDGDIAAADKLLKWIRAGSLDSTDLFRAIITGSTPADAALNARVLSVVSWLCLSGGPEVLPSAVYVTNARKPSPGLRICLDVLKSLRYTNAPEDELYDDNKVREMRIQRPGEPNFDFSAIVRGGKNMSVREAMLIAGVEAYAISLGRKFIFHHRYPEVEANYSLDRNLRKMRIESYADAERRSINLERHALLFSKVSLAEMALIVRAAVVAADRLERAGAPPDLTVLAVAEACNAYSFAEYLRMKLSAPKVRDFDMEDARLCLAEKLDNTLRQRREVRILRRFVDQKVINTVSDAQARPCRPDSRHRREVLCTFTSFEALHMTLKPVMKEHDDRERDESV